MPLPHAATVTLTGWPEFDGQHLHIGRHRVRLLGAQSSPERPGRVTVRAYPRTFPDGRIAELVTRPRMIRPASTSNSAVFSVTGHLVRLDSQTGLMRVDVLPSVSGIRPFSLTLHITQDILRRVDASVHSVQVEGRVLNIGCGYLLAERVMPVQALMPERWRGWRPRRALRAAPEAPR